ncbi:GGDEF domain-containing protein [Novispirillum itersonii]|uniref:diguanylate cyclase n=1 Tax=Novispirillum itersonii TaxID=189 RepID=A0A7W9ZIV7_NOVIT|nr:GGDEF domain-containing protein [Novispirillum itersonii]MBB6211422.1 diguanylate cyclase (GGDEF)-like protein [Novispirillum itersonii]
MRLIRAFSLKTKLIAAITVIVLIVLSAVGQALLAVTRADAVVSDTMLRRLPEALLVAELGRRTEAVLGAGRELAAARGEFDREGIMFAVHERLLALDSTISRLRGSTTPSSELQRLEDNLDLFRVQVQALSTLSSDVQRLESRLYQLGEDLQNSRDRTLEKAGPLVEGQNERLFAAAFAVLNADGPEAVTKRGDQFAALLAGLGKAGTPARVGDSAAPYLQEAVLGPSGIVQTRLTLLQLRQKVTVAVRKVDSQAQRLAAVSTQYQREISGQTKQMVQEINAQTQSSNLMLAGVAALAVIAIVVLAYYLEVRVLLRLLRLRQAIDQFGTSRSFDPVISGNDEIAGIARAFLQLAREITSRETQLVEIAHSDPLTGLANRRRFMDRFDALSRRRRPGDAAVALLVIDIDHFKDVNDRYGHLVGDECLRQIARVIERSIRTTDLVARFGGEEFLVLCTDVDADGAMVVAEKIRRAVESTTVTLPDPTASVRVTVSVGVAAVPVDAPAQTLDFDLLMEAADIAVYDAKKCGRNCIRLSERPVVRLTG